MNEATINYIINTLASINGGEWRIDTSMSPLPDFYITFGRVGSVRRLIFNSYDNRICAVTNINDIVKRVFNDEDRKLLDFCDDEQVKTALKELLNEI